MASKKTTPTKRGAPTPDFEKVVQDISNVYFNPDTPDVIVDALKEVTMELENETGRGCYSNRPAFESLMRVLLVAASEGLRYADGGISKKDPGPAITVDLSRGGAGS